MHELVRSVEDAIYGNQKNADKFTGDVKKLKDHVKQLNAHLKGR